MPRRMSLGSRERIAALRIERPTAVGPKLGSIAIKQHIPAYAFAKMLHVSEPTIYRWFYGESEPLPKYMPVIRRVVALLKRAADAGDLPLHGTYDERISALRDVIRKHGRHLSGNFNGSPSR